MKFSITKEQLLNPLLDDTGYEIAAGGPDLSREQKVAAAKHKLQTLGATVQVRRRTLAHRKKDYLHIESAGGHYEWMNIIMPAIRRWFPDAYMTSGGFSSKMYITIALEK